MGVFNTVFNDLQREVDAIDLIYMSYKAIPTYDEVYDEDLLAAINLLRDFSLKGGKANGQSNKNGCYPKSQSRN